MERNGAVRSRTSQSLLTLGDPSPVTVRRMAQRNRRACLLVAQQGGAARSMTDADVHGWVRMGRVVETGEREGEKGFAVAAPGGDDFSLDRHECGSGGRQSENVREIIARKPREIARTPHLDVARQRNEPEPPQEEAGRPGQRRRWPRFDTERPRLEMGRPPPFATGSRKIPERRGKKPQPLSHVPPPLSDFAGRPSVVPRPPSLPGHPPREIAKGLGVLPATPPQVAQPLRDLHESARLLSMRPRIMPATPRLHPKRPLFFPRRRRPNGERPEERRARPVLILKTPGDLRERRRQWSDGGSEDPAFAGGVVSSVRVEPLAELELRLEPQLPPRHRHHTSVGHQGSRPSVACENVPVGPSGPRRARRTASRAPSSTVSVPS